MANKAFEIQNSTLKIGGVELQAGNTGVVIPGVTRATSYKVEEVNDTGDQTHQFAPDTEGVVVVIDVALYNAIIAQGDERFFADYTVTTDGEGYIDEIKVNGQGSYTQLQARDAETADMYAYIGAGSASDRPLVTQDWIQVPFRPKIRAGEVETIGGGSGGSGLVQRTVNFPYGESGDTAGTMALDPQGNVYVCTADYIDPNSQTVEFTILTSEGFNIGQTGGVLMSATIAVGEYPAIDTIMQALGDQTAGWVIVGNYVTDGYERVCQARVSTNNRWSFTWTYVPGQDVDTYSQGEEFTLFYTAQSTTPIWEQLATGGSSTHIEYTDQSSGYTSTVDLSYDFAVDTENSHANFNGNGFWSIGSDNYNTKVFSTDSVAPGPLDIVIEADNNDWTFNRDGELVFPDGTKQTTAYTGQSGGGASTEMYVVINSDGHVMHSTDGTNWSEPFDAGVGRLGTVAVGPEKIIYTRSDINGDSTDIGLYAANSPSTIPALITGTDVRNGNNLYWNQVQYFEGTTYPWVAVGRTNSSPGYPVLAYSTDGVTWSFTNITVSWSNGDWEFTDIVYGNGHYVISGRAVGGGGGLWTTTDLTAEFTSTNLITDAHNFKAVEYFTSGGWNRWNAFANETQWWATGNSDPSISNDWSEYFNVDGLAGFIKDATGLVGQTVEEVASGLVNGQNFWMTSSSNGHIVWWPDAPEGPYVSIPNPAVTNISDIVRNQSGDGLPSTLILIQSTGGQDGEKITISGTSSHTENGSTTEQSYDGTYYVKYLTGNTYELYLDQQLTQPWDTSTYWPINLGGGIVTWSHGVYLDALGYANGHFYVGNDAEQLFKSEFSRDTITGNLILNWTKVDDKNDSLMYWNDFAYYSAFSTSASSSVTIAQTAPTGANGALWFNSVDGRMYIKYSGQWIDASPTEINTNQVMTSAGGSVILEGFGDNLVFGFETLLDIVADNEQPNALTIRNALVPNYGLEAYVGDDGSVNFARGNGLGGDSQWISVDTAGTTTINNGATKAWEFNTNGKLTLPQGAYIGPYDAGNDVTVTSSDYTNVQYLNMLDTVLDNARYARINFYNSGATLEVGKIVDIDPLVPATNQLWSFKTDGKLQLPQGGDIVDSNGVSVLSSGGTGNIGFVGDAIYNLNGITVENADLGHGATSAVVIPSNGTTNPLQLNNTYGPVSVLAGTNGSTKGWEFGSDGSLKLTDTGKIVSNAQDNNVVIETHDMGMTYDWTFGGNGITTVPGRIQGKTYEIISGAVENIEAALGAGADNQFIWGSISGSFATLYNLGAAAIGMKIWGIGGENNKATIIAAPDMALGLPTLHLDGPIYGNAPLRAATVTPAAEPIILGNTNRWWFQPATGTLELPRGGILNVKGTAPAHSYGEAGDVAGMTAYDGNYFYYCKQDYVDNSTNIWVRSAWTGTNW